MSFMQEHHESKLEETISIPDELKAENDSLLSTNENLRSKIEDVINNSNKKKTSLSLPKRELELVIKELVSTNEKFATVNKQLFILFNEQSIKKEQQHNIIIQADVIKIIAYELKTLTQAILGYSELLQMDFEQDTNTNNNDSIRNNNTFQKVLKVIVMSAKELQKLINEICNAAAKTENQTLNKGY
jgi:signal transduction histidine kinase